jgi:site-specific recombinase XerD
VDKLAQLAQDLPEWLHQAIRTHTLRHIPRWQAHQRQHQAHNLFGTLCRIGRWIIQHGQWPALEQLRRADLVAYLHAAQARGLKTSSINTELKYFRGFWQELLAQEQVSNGSILLVKGPKAEEPRPRFLTGTQFQRLEQHLLNKTQADQAADRFEQAWFYLLAQAGLRIGELLNLRLNDCDLGGQRLRVQAGKGNRDRVLPLTPHLCRVLARYLAVREPAESDHLLIFRGKAVGRELLAARLRQWGQHLQLVPLSPHRLRHTLATFLINQGMSITALQKFLGHRNLNTTQLYARIHDETLRQQFLSAMTRLEAIAVSDWPAPVEPLAVPVSTQCN